MSKLTKKIVDGAEIRSKPYFIWCSDLPGFGVRIFPSGKRVYYADYRNTGGTRRRIRLGHHGKLTAEEARKLALRTHGDVLKGEDPAEERTTRRNSLTVKDLCVDYMQDAERGLIMGKGNRPKKKSTLTVDRGRIARHIVPLLGVKRVHDLVQADINRFIHDVTNGKTATVEKTKKKRGKAIVKGGRGTAARTVGLLGGILSFAVSKGVIPFNPARGVKRPADKSRRRRLTPDEYRALGKALDAAEAESATEQSISGAWLIALTGCRLGEVTALKWSEIDEGCGCFRLEDSKEGRSIRPIGSPAFNVLKKISKKKGCPFVFPAVRSEGNYGGMPGAWKRITDRAGLVDVTPHTLRHSFASVAGDLGFAEVTIAAMLGHAAGSVTSRYIHHLDSVLINAADRVATTIRGYMIGEEEQTLQQDQPSDPGPRLDEVAISRITQ